MEIYGSYFFAKMIDDAVTAKKGNSPSTNKIKKYDHTLTCIHRHTQPTNLSISHKNKNKNK